MDNTFNSNRGKFYYCGYRKTYLVLFLLVIKKCYICYFLLLKLNLILFRKFKGDFYNHKNLNINMKENLFVSQKKIKIILYKFINKLFIK